MNKKHFVDVEYLLGHLPPKEAKSEFRLQVTYELKNSLNPVQAQALEHIGWFLYGGRATGRTYVAATATIIAAVDNQDTWISILDHTRLREYGESYVLDTILSIIDNSTILSLDMFEFRQASIKYIGKSQ